MHANPTDDDDDRKRSLSPYLALVGFLAALALLYLAAVAVRPEMVAQYAPSLNASQFAGSGGDAMPMKVVADVQILRQSLGQVQVEVAKLRADVDSQDERAKGMAQRVATLEGAAGVKPMVMTPEGSQDSAAAPASVAPSPATPATGVADAGKGTNAGASPSAGAGAGAGADTAALSEPAAPKILNPKGTAPSKIETGSVATPAAPATSAPVSFGPAVVKREPKAAAVQIASAPSIEALRLSWSLLSDRHATALKNLQPQYLETTDGESGPSFELLAGPFKTPAQAKKVCKELEAKSVPCAVTEYSGNAL